MKNTLIPAKQIPRSIVANITRAFAEVLTSQNLFTQGQNIDRLLAEISDVRSAVTLHGLQQNNEDPCTMRVTFREGHS